MPCGWLLGVALPRCEWATLETAATALADGSVGELTDLTPGFDGRGRTSLGALLRMRPCGNGGLECGRRLPLCSLANPLTNHLLSSTMGACTSPITFDVPYGHAGVVCGAGIIFDVLVNMWAIGLIDTIMGCVGCLSITSRVVVALEARGKRRAFLVYSILLSPLLATAPHSAYCSRRSRRSPLPPGCPS